MIRRWLISFYMPTNVAVILSAQATDVSVNKATEKLYRKANTPQAILNLGITRLKTHIRTIVGDKSLEIDHRTHALKHCEDALSSIEGRFGIVFQRC